MVQRKTYSTPRPRRLPAGLQLNEMIQGMLAWPRVNACFVGKKQIKGKATARLSLVCGVDKKIPKENIDSQEILPDTFQLQFIPTRRTRIATDVIETKGRLELEAAVLGPADVANPDRPNFRATIGIALRHPVFGDVITTAGHAIPPGLPKEARVLIESGGSRFPAEVLSITTNQFSDHALLRPEGLSLIGNFFRDITPLGPPFVPDPQTDIGTQLYVLSSNGSTKPVVCRGLQASLRTASNIVMHNLILTDFGTRGGDSGTCLVDRNWRVWGLLLGSFHSPSAASTTQDFSVFIPAFRVISLENARFL